MIAMPRTPQHRDDGLISGVVGFWKAAGDKGRWFVKNSSLDRKFRQHFLDLNRRWPNGVMTAGWGHPKGHWHC